MSLPKITSAMFILTHACNLACRYCFVHQEPCHMTYDTALEATKFLIKNAEESNQTPSINFFGGEPMLKWDDIIVPLTKWIKEEYQKPFSLAITTNGTLLNEERLQFLKDNDIGILLSIDGAKETQDYNRPYHDGSGSFDTLEKILPKYLELFPNGTFRMTTIPQTCYNIFSNIKYAIKLGYTSFFVVPNVFEEWEESSREVVKHEMQKYADYYIDCFRKGKTPIFFSTFEESLKEIKQINAAVKAKSFRTAMSCKACGKCGLGASRFASIHPNGNVYGCQEMTSNEGEKSIFYIGNIYSGIEEWRRERLMAEFDKEPVKGDKCESCKYNRICNGGCVANNYLATGSLTKLPEVYCWWKRVLLDLAIYVMQTLGKEGNEKFREKWVKL